jgi:hypothetical protein
MKYSRKVAEVVLEIVNKGLKDDDPPEVRLEKMCALLHSTRALFLTKDLHEIVGNKVIGGPFKGMLLTDRAVTDYRSPILLGCYEQELHAAFEKIIVDDYTHILNIGCSVGYYAVGLARRMPQVIVDAFDIDAGARSECAKMARENGVEDRVHIAGQFYGENFAGYADKKALVLMDIEGGEVELLDPVRFPALLKLDVLVELHDLFNPSISKMIIERFAQSHSIEIVRNRNFLPDLDVLLPNVGNIDPFDQMLLGWEGRDGETPWGIFRAKHQ